MSRPILWIILSLFILSFPYLGLAAEEKEEYKFDISEIEKKPYHLGGYGEFRPVVNGLDHDAALYKLRFYNRDMGKTTEEYNFKLLVDGSYEQDNARFFLRPGCRTSACRAPHHGPGHSQLDGTPRIPPGGRAFSRSLRFRICILPFPLQPSPSRARIE